MERKIFTNCFLIKVDEKGKPTEVCLAMKKRGFGKGMWNGSGGKPKDGESINDAVIREVNEELGVKIIKLKKKGEIDFILKKEAKKVKMHVYFSLNWENEPVETEEMKPEWFEIKNVPYDKMWAADREWLPVILSGKIIKAKYVYSQEGGEMISGEIKEV